MMSFTPSLRDQLCARIPISKLALRYVALEKHGDEWRGPSPFTPQQDKVCFVVNDSKGFYHCFSTDRHGDVIDFIMEMESLDFCSAVARACDLAHFPPPGATYH
jgi:DNA primase